MKRKIYSDFLAWKQKKRGNVALLVEGARRIGKSYAIKQFAQAEYESHIVVDFSAVNPMVMQFFDLYTDDIDTLLSNLQLYFKTKLTPRKSHDEEARSLVVFDEVQFCPCARAAIKHLVADHRFDYIETGSLVSIKKNVADIMLPSEEHAIEMFPMDFEEFLWATGNDMIVSFIREHFEQKKPLMGFHREIMTLFRQYMIVGGMPQAVAKYVKTKSFEAAEEVKRDILSLYRNDIRKYAEVQANKVTSIFDEIPAQLQRHEKKFRLSTLSEYARMRNYEEAFFWLSDAKIINCCYKSTEPSIGLRLCEERNTLKCYMGDTGLLLSHAFDARAIKTEELYKKLMFDKLEINAGMLVENIVAQMLRSAGHKLYFYSNNSRDNANDRMEIDFLVPKPTITSRHNISPIEVKSGKNYSLVSLRKCIKKYSQHLATPYVIHDGDLKEVDGIMFIPLYMTSLL